MHRFALRAILACIACAGALALFAQPANAARVVVNGTPLPERPAPVERAGRLYVPLRAIFEALGASVVYQSGLINATSGSRTVSLRIGSTEATVDGRRETLDAPPFIIGATTYVPLRFCSQALGANVNYDAASAIAYVDRAGGRPVPVNPKPVPAESVVQLRAHAPAPRASVPGKRPTISAEFTYRVKPNSLRISLDGANVTASSTRSETGFVYEPPSPLQAGKHTVVVSGQDTTGATFERRWSFTTRQEAVPANFVTINAPAPNATVGRSFVVRGSTLPNARVRVTAGRVTITNLQDVFSFLGGSFNADVTAGPRGNFECMVTINGGTSGRVGVSVTSTAPGTGQGAQARLSLNGVFPQPR